MYDNWAIVCLHGFMEFASATFGDLGFLSLNRLEEAFWSAIFWLKIDFAFYWVAVYFKTLKRYFPFLLAIPCVFVFFAAEAFICWGLGVRGPQMRGKVFPEPPGRGPKHHWSFLLPFSNSCRFVLPVGQIKVLSSEGELNFKYFIFKYLNIHLNILNERVIHFKYSFKYLNGQRERISSRQPGKCGAWFRTRSYNPEIVI